MLKAACLKEMEGVYKDAAEKNHQLLSPSLTHTRARVLQTAKYGKEYSASLALQQMRYTNSI